MGTIMPFDFDGRQVRTVSDQDGCIWFVATDVCAVLEIRNSRDALSRLEPDETNSVGIADGTRGNPEHATVNESGLYSLIFRSRKPQARAFRYWVTREVLPSIRRTGRYELPADGITVPALLSLADGAPSPVRMASRALALALSEHHAPPATCTDEPAALELRTSAGVALPESVWSMDGQWMEIVCDDPPAASALAAHLIRRTARIGGDLDLSIRRTRIVRFRHHRHA